MIYAEILASGTGSRMGKTELPKQFLMLGEKPILIHTIEQFIINKKIDIILVCVSTEWISYTQDILKKYGVNLERIEIVAGGVTRNETIINGCKFIEEKYGINEDDIILTHDAARPFVSQKIIDKNIEEAYKYDAIDTAVPCTDTIIEVNNKKISNIPVRDFLYSGQTPQTFNIKKLMKYYKELSEKEKSILSDACKIFVLKGEKVKVVEGEYINMKITTQTDLILGNAILTENNY